MTDWQITAKTIYCDAVEDEVTIMVYRNAPTRCTGCKKYNEPNKITQGMMRAKASRLKKPIKCEGEQCPRVTQYKTGIMAEDAE
jgi:hypothetical protein